MALKVYRKRNFIVLDNGSDKDFLQGANSTFDITGEIVSFSERGTTLKNESESFDEIQDQSGTSIGNIQAVEDYLVDTMGFNAASGGNEVWYLILPQITLSWHEVVLMNTAPFRNVLITARATVNNSTVGVREVGSIWSRQVTIDKNGSMNFQTKTNSESKIEIYASHSFSYFIVQIN